MTGAGLATLAGGLQAHRPDLLDGVAVVVGVDRFMSEARALTNFSGNAVGTVDRYVDQHHRQGRATQVLLGNSRSTWNKPSPRQPIDLVERLKNAP